MNDALKLLVMMFYAPVRGMREIRERAPFGSALAIAFVAQFLRGIIGNWGSLMAARRAGSSVSGNIGVGLAVNFFGLMWTAIVPVLLLIVVLTPITILVANLFDRSARFGLVLQQEFSSVATAILYAWTAASLLTLPFAVIVHLSGIDAAAQQTLQRFQEIQKAMLPDQPPPPEAIALALALLRHFVVLVVLSPFVPFVLWFFLSVRELFRLSVWRTFAVIAVSGVLMFPATALFAWLMITALGSPLILLLLFWLLRGYFGGLVQTQRARAAFRQNLETATLNPADASAHYNLGLLHLQRKELEQARERFQKAIEIDPDDVDSHYQLGRIARAQGRYADAISHFNETVARDPQHAQHEVWREVGATYLAANQFDDAREALERFLQERPNDAEGLYLMGRALAGLGRRREAAEAMRACIEAVKTAPAYKYRAEKHWMSEAQQFLRSNV
jgi:tetratricopeptide (TPR) repeat protein